MDLVIHKAIIEVATLSNRGGKCPCNDVRIISSLLDNHVDDLLSFTVYLQGTDAAMEVEGAEDGIKGKGRQIYTLLDT